MKKTFAGPIKAATGGRTDRIPLDVPEGSYVIPADIVSGLGQGNTDAGHKILGQMFPPARQTAGKSVVRHKAVPAFGSGGAVPIIAAGGEHVLSPSQVAAIGGGDVDYGHSILDALVNHWRNQNIATLSSLPGPKGG